jgi:hypothetical protein
MRSADRALASAARPAWPPGWVARTELAPFLVVATGKHYVFDVVAGLCAVAVGSVVRKVAPTRAR